MHTGVRRLLSVVAIAAIGLHTALWGGTATLTSVAVVDPFSVICHSGGSVDGTADQAPSSPVPAPGHACDHCNLCGSTSPPVTSPVVAVIQPLPSQPAHALAPVSTVARGGLEVVLKGARGPPVFA